MGTARTPGSRPRPRYLRLAAAAASGLVTMTAVLGGVGLLPGGGDASYAASSGAPSGSDSSEEQGLGAISLATGQHDLDPGGSGDPDASAEAAPRNETLPRRSGEGRRVVFDKGDQRVWLVRRDGTVKRTYLVSGSLYQNLDPGRYEVFSRSKDASGIDGSTMRFMVRFAHGPNAAIGFHDIPTLDDERVQTRAELGTPLSHGCIRQWRPDAKAMWRFAPVGTTVVVTP